MAIVINQQPTSPNMANADVIFSVSSTTSTQPQFQFVIDIYESGSASRLQRIKQQPNPSGFGVFNVGQILKSFLSSDDVWKTQKFATSSNANKDFIVYFGEEYGTSLSSSITLYNGISATPGDPAKSGSAFYTITNGLVDPYDAVAWNFPSASYYTAESASVYNKIDDDNDVPYYSPNLITKSLLALDEVANFCVFQALSLAKNDFRI